MKQRGFLDSNFAMYIVGFSLLVWFISFVMGWIYETKEQRSARSRHTAKDHLALNLTKEQIIKYGVGEFEANCSGLFLKTCVIAPEPNDNGDDDGDAEQKTKTHSPLRYVAKSHKKTT